jgi:hypothetical protein
LWQYRGDPADNSERSNKMNIKKSVNFLLIFLLSLILASCQTPPVPHTKTFKTALDFDDDDRWVVLARPNSIWTLGTIVEIKDGGSPEDLGTVLDLNCFPDDAIIEKSGEAPSTAYGTAIDYGLSLSATIGLPHDELVKADLNFGDSGQSPNHKTVLKLDKATERRWSFIKLEEYIAQNYAGMSSSCKRLLIDPDRFILDKIYQINKGALEVVDNHGVKVDLSTPKFKKIANAALSAGFKVNKEGSLTVKEGSPPITFAVRQADFDKILNEIGIETRGTKGGTFEKAMEAAGASVPY